jgi:hypothetical protein
VIVDELMGLLDGVDPEVEVRIASQPAYPMQHFVDAAVKVESACRIEVDEEADPDDPDSETTYTCEVHEEEFTDPEAHQAEYPPATIVYLVEGDQPYLEPYLPGFVREELGW